MLWMPGPSCLLSFLIFRCKLLLFSCLIRDLSEPLLGPGPYFIRDYLLNILVGFVIILAGTFDPDVLDGSPFLQFPYKKAYIALARLKPLYEVIQRQRLVA